jgi:hypothetical protein
VVVGFFGGFVVVVVVAAANWEVPETANCGVELYVRLMICPLIESTAGVADTH